MLQGVVGNTWWLGIMFPDLYVLAAEDPDGLVQGSFACGYRSRREHHCMKLSPLFTENNVARPTTTRKIAVAPRIAQDCLDEPELRGSSQMVPQLRQ